MYACTIAGFAKPTSLLSSPPSTDQVHPIEAFLCGVFLLEFVAIQVTFSFLSDFSRLKVKIYDLVKRSKFFDMHNVRHKFK